MINNDIMCKSKFINRQKKFIKKRSQMLVASVAAGLVLLGGTTGAQAISPEAADLNDNGRVDIRDMRKLLSKRGLQSGELGYLEGQDLVPDSVIDSKDVLAIRSKYRQSSSTSNTTLSGRVYGAQGHVLEGVKVFVGSDPAVGLLAAACVAPLCATTNAAGEYILNIPAANTGETQISFVGNAVIDPTPSLLSGEYPTIPHKPIFINGGTDVIFRDLVLPERNLNGAVDLSTFNATDNGGGSYTLNESLVIDNNGMRLTIPSGCTVVVIAGENPVLSATRVPPSMLPVAMPPGLQSTQFQTFQPGETKVTCGAGVKLLVELDNLDAFEITSPSTPTANKPIFAGVVNGVFQEFTRCEVDDDDGNGIDGDVNDILRCDFDSPFTFAWYHADRPPLPPCPRTTVIGQVKLFGSLIPVQGATVSLLGVGPVTTDANGNFSTVNVPAGPNGPLCTTRPFSIRTTATGSVGAGATDTSISAVVSAVSGGSTDVGMIVIGDPDGTVQGSVKKLSRISPLLVDSLPGADITLTDVLSGVHNATTNTVGSYMLTGVELGSYNNIANFLGTVTLPALIDEDPTINSIDEDNDGSDGEDPVDGIDNDGDGSVVRSYNIGQTGSVSDPNIPSINDFRVTGTGTIVVTFNNIPTGYTIGRTFSNGGFYGTFVIQPQDNRIVNLDDQQPNNSTFVSFLGVPMGPCRISLEDGLGHERLAYEEIDGCFINEDGQVLTIAVDASDYEPPQPKQFSGAFTFFAIGSIGLGAAATRRRRVYPKLK